VATALGDRVTVGLVHGLNGLRGAVRVEILSDDPGRFAVGSVVFAEGDDRALTVTWAQESKPGVLVLFEEIASREAADHLRGRYLEAAAGAPLPSDSWYWHEIHGLEVRTVDGTVLGTVQDIFRAGGAEVYVVRGGTLGEILVPGVEGVVVELDPAAGHMIVDPVRLALPDKPPRRRRRHEHPRRTRKPVT
jgi:16S rRNA processing protein RimM